MANNRQEVLDLFEHPPMEEIYEQHRARIEGDDSVDHFGDYRVQPVDASPLQDPSMGLYRWERISPVSLESAHNLGAFIVRGVTEDERDAFILINPFNTPEESVGTVILY